MEQFNQQAICQKGKKILLSIAGKNISFSEQLQRNKKLHSWFHEQGLNLGSKVLVIVEDELEQASILIALIASDRVAVVVDPKSKPAEIEAILSTLSFDAIIGQQNILSCWFELGTSLPVLKVEKKQSSKGTFGRLLRKKQLSGTNWPALELSEIDLPELKLPQDSLAYIIYTSGTTSLPKGVEISIGALFSQLDVLRGKYELCSEAKLLNTLPMHHVDGFVQGPVLAWYTGCTLYRPLAFTAQNIMHYMDSIYANRITHFITVPTMLSLIYRLGKDLDDAFEGGDFKYIVSCAGHLEPHLWSSFEQHFKTIIINMYGLSETVTSALFSGPDEESRQIGTLGLPVNCEVKIVNPEKHEEECSQGELCIKGPQLMTGYHGNIDNTKRTIVNGWLLTGDLVEMASGGCIRLIGRKKNQIISGGRNISPEEVTEVINTHINVVESDVMGVHDAEWGERPVALVVKGTPQLSADELNGWMRESLSDYKVPKEILFVNQLEKGPSGKIIQSKVREQYEHLSSQIHMQFEQKNVEDKIREIAVKSFNLTATQLPDHATPESTPGWDSLGHMIFVGALESSFNIRLSATEIMKLNSLLLAEEIVRQKQQIK